jgi:hypothetical protein
LGGPKEDQQRIRTESRPKNGEALVESIEDWNAEPDIYPQQSNWQRSVGYRRETNYQDPGNHATPKSADD